jgi:hypothetical protein
MVFPYLTSLFSKKKNKIQSKPTIFDTFPELNQGQAYLQRRNTVQQAMGGHLNLIEGFANPPAAVRPDAVRPDAADWRDAAGWHASRNAGAGAYSCCSSDCTPRYGYCPSTFGDLQYEKDDNPSQRQAEMTKFNQLLSQYGGVYKNYIGDVSNYVTNPPTGLLGQNLVVPQLGGAAPWGPGHQSPPPPSPACPPNTCISYKGQQYRTLTGFNPNDPHGAPEAGGCDIEYTASIPKGWRIAPADADSIKVVGMYDWGVDVLVLEDGSGYNTKNYAANFAGTAPGALWGSDIGVGLDTPTPNVAGCSMAILLKSPPHLT